MSYDPEKVSEAYPVSYSKRATIVGCLALCCAARPIGEYTLHPLHVLSRLRLLAARVRHENQFGPKRCLTKSDEHRSGVDAAAEAKNGRAAAERRTQCADLISSQ